MDVRTYRARTLQEALRLIRDELGPAAAVLHTREVSAGWFGSRQIEVTASNEVHVPSRLPAELFTPPKTTIGESKGEALPPRKPTAERVATRANAASPSPQRDGITPSLQAAYGQLIQAGFTDAAARGLIQESQQLLPQEAWTDSLAIQGSLVRIVEHALRIQSPLPAATNECRTVALVGPTGVGKTTTIAKLAANVHVREKRRVGLITVDTYRIAAVEQLRTYADIIDLPMEVVTTPGEMAAAVQQFADLDLVLIDTAGRSPRDASQIQELRALLAAAQADEVQLVLSCATAASTLERTVERFAAVGATHLTLTKLDEAWGLGALYPLLRSCPLPVVWLTHGQNVPHDISPAERRLLAQLMLGQEAAMLRGEAH